MIKYIIITFLLLGFSCEDEMNDEEPVKILNHKPTVSFTFDDGITNDIVDFKFEVWNEMILKSLGNAGLKAIFFVTGFNKTDVKGSYLLAQWDNNNHNVANHTFSHPNFNDEKNSPNIFKTELLSTDSIINKYSNYVKLFRFPYLKEGKTREKINSIRTILKNNEYENGHVTIDASDWYINSRLIKKMKSGEPVDTLAFQKFYLDHILERSEYYESLAHKLTGRHISHTLLLHHNLTSALFLDELIEEYKAKGWNVVDAVEAYKDPIYKSVTQVIPAGESLIWSLAKELGKYEDILRYPAEDSRYEEDKMNSLNL